LRVPVAILLLAAPLLSVALQGCGGMPRQGMARGSDLYDTCVPCHGRHGAGDATLGAPVIAGLPRWYIEAQLGKFRNGLRGTHPADMEGHRMRPMARSLNIEGDVGSVAQYVASLPPVHPSDMLKGGDPTAGASRYTTVCTVCHGADAKGMEAMGAPELLSQPDWYLLRQLDKFKSGMRGFDSTDAQGQQMATMSSTLEDHQAMLDVIAYIRTLRGK
jgi:cytochrome c553